MPVSGRCKWCGSDEFALTQHINGGVVHASPEICIAQLRADQAHLEHLSRRCESLTAENKRLREALEHAAEYLSIIDTAKGRSAIGGIIREALNA